MYLQNQCRWLFYCAAADMRCSRTRTTPYYSSPSRWPRTVLRSAHNGHEVRRDALKLRRLRSAAQAKLTSAAAAESDSSQSSSSMKLLESSAAYNPLHAEMMLQTYGRMYLILILLRLIMIAVMGMLAHRETLQYNIGCGWRNNFTAVSNARDRLR